MSWGGLRVVEELPERLVIRYSATSVRASGVVVLIVGAGLFGGTCSIFTQPVRSDQVGVAVMFIAVGLLAMVGSIFLLKTPSCEYTFSRSRGRLFLEGKAEEPIPLEDILEAKLFVNTGSDVDSYGVNLVVTGREEVELCASSDSTAHDECMAVVEKINRWLAAARA